MNWPLPLTRLLIAEIGSVHDGSFGNACKLVEAAAAAGAGAVKFQTHLAEAETLTSAPMPSYFRGEPRMEYFRRTAFSAAQWKEIASCCERNRVIFLSSPFSLEAVDLLEETGMTAYKIPSGEVSNLPLLERIAATGKPVLLSSGMSGWEDLDRAVAVLKERVPLLVMQCTSEYPCLPERVGLNLLKEIRDRYGVAAGYSDHTTGCAAPIAAAAMGALVIEKHFTFSRLMYGSDARHSMEPESFRQLAGALVETWAILANPVEKSAAPFSDMKRIFEKSIVLARDLPGGKVLGREDIAFKKPGDGIRACDYSLVIGKKLNQPFPKDHKLSPSDIS